MITLTIGNVELDVDYLVDKEADTITLTHVFFREEDITNKLSPKALTKLDTRLYEKFKDGEINARTI